MNKDQLSLSDYQIFLYKTLGFLVLTAIGFLLALTGFFYGSLAWVGAAIFACILVRQVLEHRVNIRPSKELWLAMLGSLLIVGFFSLFVTPTVFSGRDQGAISEAAARLAQNHQFAFSTPASDTFFQLHQPGRAQNFPGFYYTKSGQLITQFPLVYITWLALFFSLFGVTGFIIANAVAFWFFLMSFYLLTRLFINLKTSLLPFSFVITSFIFMWFFKFTLSENLALPLLWISILSLLLFLKSLRKLHFITFLLAIILLCFTRIEGYALLLTCAIAIYAHEDARQHIKESAFYFFWLPFGAFLILFAVNGWIDQNFYRELAKAFIPKIVMPQAKLLGDLKTQLPDFFVLRLFYLYGMLGFFLVGAVSILHLIWKKEHYALLPLLITLPTFIYLFDSHITPDQPWMLRRYMFSLVPVAIFYSGLLIGQIQEKKSSPKYKIIALTFAALLLIGNATPFLTYLTYSENSQLLPQVAKLSQQFQDNDLILIDREAAADGWNMITGPLSFLYGKNAVYFFNLQDLAKINTEKYGNVYLIAPNSQVPYYLSSTFSKRLSAQNDYSLRLAKLSSAQNDLGQDVTLPTKTELTVNGKIFKVK